MIYQKQDKLIKGLAKYYGQDLFDYLEALEKETDEINCPFGSNAFVNFSSLPSVTSKLYPAEKEDAKSLGVWYSFKVETLLEVFELTLSSLEVELEIVFELSNVVEDDVLSTDERSLVDEESQLATRNKEPNKRINDFFII